MAGGGGPLPLPVLAARPGGQDGGGSQGPRPVRAATALRPRLAPQPFGLAEYGGSRGLRHHALGRHGGREDPAAGSGCGAPVRPRRPSPWGRSPGPTPGCLAPRGPAPGPPSHGPRGLARRTPAPPLPHGCPALALAACKFSGSHSWGRAPRGEHRPAGGGGGFGPWGHFLLLGL